MSVTPVSLQFYQTHTAPKSSVPAAGSSTHSWSTLALRAASSVAPFFSNKIFENSSLLDWTSRIFTNWRENALIALIAFQVTSFVLSLLGGHLFLSLLFVSGAAYNGVMLQELRRYRKLEEGVLEHQKIQIGYRTSLRVMHKNNETLTKVSGEFKTHYQTAQEQLKQSQEQQKEMQKQLDQTTENLEKTKGNLDQTTVHLEATTKHLETTQTNLSSTTTHLEMVKGQLDATTLQLATLKGLTQSVKDNLNSLEKNTSGSSDLLDHISTTRDEIDETLKKSETLLAQLKSAGDAENKKLIELLEKITSSKKVQQDTLQLLLDMQEKIKEGEKRSLALNDEIDRKQKEGEMRAKALADDIERQRKDGEERLKAIGAEIDQKRKELEAVCAQLQAATEELKKASVENIQTQQNLNAMVNGTIQSIQMNGPVVLGPTNGVTV